MTLAANHTWAELADAVLTHDRPLQLHAWTPTHEAPEFRLRDIRPLARDPRCEAVEEILALRHDVDDHALAITLLRGLRPDLDVLSIEGAITELLHLGSEVRRTESRPGDWARALDVYECQLSAFARGGAR